MRLVGVAAPLVLFATLALAAPGSAQEPAPTAPTAQTVLTLPSGLVLPVPDGWRGQAADDGVTAGLVGPDGETTVIASLQSATREQVMAQLASPIDLGLGIVLTPIERAQVSADEYVGDYAVSGATQPASGVVLVRALPDGRAVVFIGIAPVGAVEPARRILREMLASSDVREPLAAAPAAAGGWANYLRGRYIVRLYTSGNYREKHELWLCSDGTFLSALDGGGFTAGVASGAFGSNRSGDWSASGDLAAAGTLTLTSGNGQSSQMTARMDADGLYLNGERWLRGDENTRCR